MTSDKQTEQGRIVLAGGSGFCGAHLAEFLATAGYEVVVLSRNPGKAGDGKSRTVRWDGKEVDPAWAKEVDGAKAVINLSGRSVNCRYTPENRRAIYDSRLLSTAAVGKAIAACENPPEVWLNAASSTIYRHATDVPQDEATGETPDHGGRPSDEKWAFSVDVCKRWEAALFEAEDIPDSVRKIALRISMVFGQGSGGVHEAFSRLAKIGLGGTLGTGDQWVSWIHVDDFCRAVLWLIEDSEIDGPVNLTAPQPLPNRDLMAAFRRTVGMPIGLPAFTWMLEIGAIAMRTETELLLKSRRVVPGRLLEGGFEFHFPEFEEAVREIEGKA